MTKTAATSSTMAEVSAACEAGKDIICLRQLMGQLGYKQPGSSRILEDSNGCWTSLRMQRRRKLRLWQGVRLPSGLVNNGSVHLAEVDTDENPADTNTQALPREKFLK